MFDYPAGGHGGRVGPALAGRPRAASRGDDAPWQRRRDRQLRLDSTCDSMYIEVAARGRAAKPDKSGGKSEHLRAFMDFRWVQTGTYPLLYPLLGSAFSFFQRFTHGEDYRTLGVR